MACKSLTMHACLCVYRQAGLIQISLHKNDPSDSLGLSLVQRRSGNLSTIFVNTLSPGGIAERNGQIRVGDRLVQVNGTSLVGCSHAKAVRLLREISGGIVLTVSRSPCRSNSPKKQTTQADVHAAPSDLDLSTSSKGSIRLDGGGDDDDDDDNIDDLLDEAVTYLQTEEEEEVCILFREKLPSYLGNPSFASLSLLLTRVTTCLES
jgi:C-terminal processing protease CtpA/Prc